MPFQKGVVHKHKSPGRPKGFKGVAKMIMKETSDGWDLVKWTLDVWQNKDGKYTHEQVVDARNWLSDRGLGRAMQMIDLAAHLEVDVVDHRFALVECLNRLEGAERAEFRRLMLKATGDGRTSAQKALDNRPVIDVPEGGGE